MTCGTDSVHREERHRRELAARVEDVRVHTDLLSGHDDGHAAPRSGKRVLRVQRVLVDYFLRRSGF